MPTPVSPSEPLFGEFEPVPTDTWIRQIEKDLRGAEFDRLAWSPSDELRLRPFYRREDLASLTHAPEDVGTYLSRRPNPAWRIVQEIRVDSPDRANHLVHEALGRGVDEIAFVLEYKRDGSCFSAIQRISNLELLLDGLPLEHTAFHFHGRRLAVPVLAMWLEVASRRGVPAARLHGSVDLDPLSELLCTGMLAVQPALDVISGVLSNSQTTETSIRFLTLDAEVYRNAGATVVQELAFTLAAASEYLAGLTDRGHSVAHILERFHFRVPVGTSYFVEIAKLRALRLLYAQLVEAYDPDRRPYPPAHVHGVTSRWSYTLYDPYVNMLRATTEAAAAVIGGCDMVTVRPFDAVAGVAGDLGHRIARNVQLILRHEAHLDAVVDPAAGSYYVEKLTDELARAAWSLFQEVEARGGWLAAARQGFMQDRIRTARERKERALADRSRALVGTNLFPDPDETRLADVVADDPDALWQVLPVSIVLPVDEVRKLLRDDTPITELSREVTDSDGVHVEPLPRRRAAEPFEELRLRTERRARELDHRPSVFLLPVGDPVAANARATFALNFLGCAGFRVVANVRFDDTDEAVRAARASGAEIVVVCSSDAEYARFVPGICKSLKQDAQAPMVLVAGGQEDTDTLKEAGVDGFIHKKSNLLETLTALQERLGLLPETR